MRKNSNNFILFILILIAILFIFPSNTYAINEQTNRSDINDTQNLEVGNLSFSNIKFRDYSTTSTKAFGLTGDVYNSSDNKISYSIISYYYDSNHNLIAKEYNSATAINGNNKFNQMSNLSILGGHNVNEINYYQLEIDIINSIDSSGITNSSELTPSKNSKYHSYDYVIDKYDINIMINENNTFDITETITAYFNVAKHGIFRIISLKNTITRLDGTTSSNRTRVTNVSVDNKYTKLKEKGNYKLKIGSTDRTIIGEQKYVIKYKYNLGKDPVKNYDELYYNIIGKDWDTAIGNISFSITMPKEFDSSKLGFSAGYIGSTDNSNVKYNVSGNKITGNYNDILEIGEALTVRCELPEGYFVGAKLNIYISDYLIYLIPIIFLLISIFLWYKFGRDEEIVETVEFYPPENLNSLDVGFLYKGKAENKDITSLLIFLANKGYLEINDKKIDLNSKKINLSEDSMNSANKKIIELQNKINDEKLKNPNSKKIKYYENMLDIYKNIDTPINYEEYGLKRHIKKSNRDNDFIIKKLKDYDGNNMEEQWVMDGLFEYDRTEVTNKLLYNKFYKTNDRILKNINRKQNLDKIFEKSSSNKKIIIILMIIVSFLLITMQPLFTYGINEELISALIGTTVGFLAILGALVFKTNIAVKIFGLLWGLGFGLIPWFMVLLPKLTENFTYQIGYVIGIVCIIIMIICSINIKKRTKYGNEMLGKIKGFKNFLENVEKEKLESLIVENPNYFYDILPYTYVLGVSDKWIKKFESISLEAPSWYAGSNSFTVSSFGSFIDHTMTSAQSAMTADPTKSSSSSSSSSGSSSGGGSAGGGSGGGGGSSW